MTTRRRRENLQNSRTPRDMARPERVEAPATQAGRPQRREGQSGRQETNDSRHCKPRESANQRSRQQGKLTNNRERSREKRQLQATQDEAA